ncbi:MAG TPA: RagB/SusD family nutrient uptake outer membrane protein [Flavitalea sp.]|nr:RagB/SusD family nutrient uptake outer membrane protein [Flavitalea sp.]
MKKYRLILSAFAVLGLALFLQSCKNILDRDPVNQYSDPTVWSDANVAEAYLLNNYQNLKFGFTQVMVTAISDETRFTHGGAESYNRGELSPASLLPFNGTYANGWKQYYDNIQRINVFLANIDRVPEATAEAERPLVKARTDAMKGEAYFIRAYCYTQLARLYGGVVLLDQPSELGDDFLGKTRASFEETVKFIVDDCDAAAGLLASKAATVMGRATKATALALKSRMLLFAASDLTADGTAANKYVGYESPDRTALWTAAKNAAKAVMDLNENSLADFGAPDQAAVAKGYFEFFKAKDLSDPEIIWGKMYSLAGGDINRTNQLNDGNGWHGYSDNSATQQLVNVYQMEDGSDFSDHFTKDGNNNYINISSKYHSENPYYNREPRFYGTILFDSAVWKPRDAAFGVIDPLGVYDRRTRIVINGGVETFKRFGLDTRQSDRSPDNGGYTGYLMKKHMDDGIVTGVVTNENIWVEFRYAEILLNYAEACIGLGEIPEATTYINMIRNRVALPDFTGDITKALREERQKELSFESIRWYDIRRWKILLDVMTDAKGIDIVETTTDGVKKTVWTEITAEVRSITDPKYYWLPISADESNRAPQLTQNPGY